MVQSTDMKKIIAWGAGILGIVCVGVAVVYFITPAQSLPSFMPGFDVASAKIHYKHAIGSFVLGLGLFALAWFGSAPAKVSELPQQ